jgi:hypothetical protein
VDTSFKLWLAASVTSLLGSLLSFATQDAVTEEVAGQLGVPVEQASAPGGGIISTVFSLVLTVIWVLLIFAMRSGANWARIVLTVLGVLGILGLAFGLLALPILFSVGILGILQGLLNIATLVLVIAAIVFQFKTDANEYFRRS